MSNGKHLPVRRATALEYAFREYNEHLPPDTIEVRPGVSIKIHPDSRHAFEHFCYLSPEMVDEMNCFVALTKGKSNLLDVGALHGIFSLVFAVGDRHRRVLAVDPSPIAFARLLYNIHRNRFNNIEAIECAASEAHGTLAMHYEWEHAVAAGMGVADKLLEVEMNSGDAICQSRNFLPDVIKVDVEGHEVKVLKGLRSTIARCRPLIFLEIHPSRIAEEGDSVESLESFFGELRYSARRVDNSDFAFSSLRASLPGDARIVLTP